MKAKLTLGLSFLLVLMLATFASAQVVPVTIVEAEIENTDILPSGVNQLDLERNDDFELRLELFTPVDADDVEIRAFISGYEYNDINPISKRIGPFDLDANVTYVRKLTLSLPDDIDLDDYKLRVEISDRNSDARTTTYNLQINTPRHDMQIEDVILSPGNTVEAGKALLATVRVENKGQKDEDDVKVTVSIPALGLSATDYIDEVEEDEEEETEELFIRLPKCAEAGQYEMLIEVKYNEGHDSVSGTGTVTVLENADCAPEPAPVVVVEPEMPAEPVEEAGKSKVRGALEIILLILVALLVVVGLIIGFTRMREE